MKKTRGQETAMSDFVQISCVRVMCGECKDAYEDDDIGYVYFDTQADAVRCITQVGWTVDGDSARCPACVLRDECLQKGHVWDDWRHCRCGCAVGNPSVKDHVEPVQCRTCARCSDVDWARPGRYRPAWNRCVAAAFDHVHAVHQPKGTP